MAFLTTNDYLTGRTPVPTPSDAGVMAVRFPMVFTTANIADMTLNTIGQVGVLPAGCVPVDVHYDMTDPDASTAALVMQVGIWDGSGASISTAAADGGAHWGVTAATTAAATASLTKNGAAMNSVMAAATDRKLGVKVTTAPTTPQAFTLGVTLFFRAARNGE
jgi:hypothetical protein